MEEIQSSCSWNQHQSKSEKYNSLYSTVVQYILQNLDLNHLTITSSGLNENGPNLIPLLAGWDGTFSYHMALTSIDRNSRAKQQATLWTLLKQFTVIAVIIISMFSVSPGKSWSRWS